MAGVCSENFTIGFRSKIPDITNDGLNKLKGRFGRHFDAFYGYKNERWDSDNESGFSTNLLIIK